MLVGHIAALWRYPVKSMQGQQCGALTIGTHGIDGDRRFAFKSDDAPIGKPLLRSADRAAMLRSRAQLDASGAVTVQMANGACLPVSDETLPHRLALAESARSLRLLENQRPLTDVRPISLHSAGTERALAEALDSFDARRLRSNIILRLANDQPFAEDDLTGKTLQLGSVAQISMLERIPRCRMVSLDPETAEANSDVLRWLARTRDGRAGVYARTRSPGAIAVGDEVRLIPG